MPATWTRGTAALTMRSGPGCATRRSAGPTGTRLPCTGAFTCVYEGVRVCLFVWLARPDCQLRYIVLVLEVVRCSFDHAQWARLRDAALGRTYRDQAAVHRCACLRTDLDGSWNPNTVIIRTSMKCLTRSGPLSSPGALSLCG
jgi:hypothetical protein